ncbi:MAG: glutathione peroxidase [Cyclobacteriaceae bacterium]|nr:glutathione peroxidase [Cyclobacteriaceae bacterium]
MTNEQFYSLKTFTPSGDELPLSNYKGKVLLIVNTATQCGLTPQFVGLEELHQKYKDQGLVVLGFPCNQFMGQEPLKDTNMEESCRLNHGVTFQLTKKSDVNGDNTNEVFAYLKKHLKGTFGDAIKWNFTKFLVDADGKPVKRYAPTTKPDEIEGDIVDLLKKVNA